MPWALDCSADWIASFESWVCGTTKCFDLRPHARPVVVVMTVAVPVAVVPGTLGAVRVRVVVVGLTHRPFSLHPWISLTGRFGCVAPVVLRDSAAGVLGVVDRVLDQLGDVVAVSPVEDLVRLSTRLHESRHPEFGQVLGHAGRRFPHRLGELVDRPFAIEQRPQQPDPGGVREHPEHLDREIDLLPHRRRPMRLRIFTHT
jgi:hypothetical protein